MTHGADTSPAETMPHGDSTGDMELLRAGLVEEIAQLDRELEEIGLLARQAHSELERHDARRQKGDERVTLLEGDARAATKEFIFDVRPMVLDDLGLVPTVRRTAADRGRGGGVEVDFASSGTDRRLPADLESGLFRILDDAIGGYALIHPTLVTVRLDWAEQEVFGTIRAHWPSSPADAPGTGARRQPEPSADMPPALAAIIEQNASDQSRARVLARSLPDPLVEDLRERAATLGVAIAFRDNGQSIELTARAG